MARRMTIGPSLVMSSFDFDLQIRMLKMYGYIHNMNETLLNYRLHNDQVTYNGGKSGSQFWNNIRNNIIKKLLN